jgi:hypothetical protein
MTGDELAEKLWTEYYWRQPVMWNALVRHKLASFAALRDLGSWYDLYDLRNVGQLRILSLVNFVREQGFELPWFEQWDKDSERWSLAAGRPRVPAPETPHALV